MGFFEVVKKVILLPTLPFKAVRNTFVKITTGRSTTVTSEEVEEFSELELKYLKRLQELDNKTELAEREVFEQTGKLMSEKFGVPVETILGTNTENPFFEMRDKGFPTISKEQLESQDQQIKDLKINFNEALGELTCLEKSMDQHAEIGETGN